MPFILSAVLSILLFKKSHKLGGEFGAGFRQTVEVICEYLARGTVYPFTATDMEDELCLSYNLRGTYTHAHQANTPDCLTFLGNL